MRRDWFEVGFICGVLAAHVAWFAALAIFGVPQ